MNSATVSAYLVSLMRDVERSAIVLYLLFQMSTFSDFTVWGLKGCEMKSYKHGVTAYLDSYCKMVPVSSRGCIFDG